MRRETELSCEVWWARPDAARPWHRDLFTPDELGRADAYRRRADRDRFTVGCAVSRIVLGRRLGLAPADVPLRRDCDSCGRPHGRPRLPGDDLHLSVSHSGDWVAVAVTGLGPVGVDVEQHSARALDLAETVLAPAEAAALARLPVGERAAAMIGYWARKEAVVKATGDGLRAPLSGVRVSPPGEPARLLAYDGRPDLVMALRDLPSRPGHAAAIAVLGLTSPPPVAELDATALLAEPEYPDGRRGSDYH
ncbi:4'-phosphopantetheinyl transferase superfamily protein [Thermopolyspora sp. NPDC052614]|uniref:4'-phosphopantetheinyl transferase family protein n=1 Tax=Thermopolyspora sp. NPDC052614 TaxID=3155682 RepID=UPI0034426542